MSAKFIRIITVASIFCFSSITLAENKSILPIKKWQTQSGTPVLFVQEKELPMVDVQVIFDAGSSRDGTKQGLARITNETLSAGTRTKTANDIASAFDDVGARLSLAVSRDMAAVALRSLSDDKFFKPAFAAFTDVITQPSFPASEFDRIKKQTLTALEEQEELPASIAAKAFYNALYDKNPYGHPVAGDKESVSKLTPADLEGFYKKYYTSQNALIAIVGNITEERAKQLAEEVSSHLNKGSQLSKLEFNNMAQKPLNEHIAFPSSQTHVLIGQAGINRNDPAYFSVMVGNYILGGGSLTSRLFDEVREKRGLAYSVRSQFNALKDKGPFIIELQTRNSEALNAIKVVNETLKQFVSSGPSQKELASAKKNLTQGFVLRLASNSAIIAQLVNIGFYHLPLNYLDTYQANISSVTDGQVKQVFQSLIHPDNLVTITVGNNSTAQNGQQSIQ